MYQQDKQALFHRLQSTLNNMTAGSLIPRFLMIIVSIALLFSLASGKVYSSSLGIPYLRRQGCWVFLDRMHLDPGTLRIQFEVKLISNNYKQSSLYEVELAAIPSSVWEISLENKCDRGKFTEEEARNVHNQELAIHADLSAQNNYSFQTRSTLEITKEETYHFVFRHCSKTLLGDGYGRDVKLDLYVNLQNNDSYHSSTESTYGWLLPLLLVLGGCMLRYLYKEKEEEGDNWIKWTLKISLWVGLVSILIKYIGFMIYAYVNGAEYQFFDFTFLLLHSVADSAIIVVLLLLAFGWTVTFNNSMDFDLYVPLACMLGFVNIIMTVLSKIADGEHDKYHMFDTIPAYIMVGFRMLAFCIFIGGIVKVTLSIKGEEHSIRRYFRELGLLGTIYLTFLPASMYLITFIDTKYRKQTLYFALQLSRFALNVWLVLLCGRKTSTYRKIIDKSFMQKGEKYY